MSKPNISEVPIKWVDGDVVRQLEELLENARSGELTGIIYVAIWHGNSTNSGWAGFPRGYSRTAIGELAVLQHELSGMAAGV